MLLPLLLTALAGSASDPWVAGTWTVTLTTDYSSCESTKKGETATEQWVFSPLSDKGGEMVTVKVVGGSRSRPSSYLGAFEGDGVALMFGSPGAKVSVELKGDAKALTGRMIVAVSEPCAIIYTFDGKR